MHLLIPSSSAFGWLRERCEKAPPPDEVWRLRSEPLDAEAAVWRVLEFDLFQDQNRESGEWIELRCAFDELLLKTMALAVGPGPETSILKT